jgi:hypothetical protein
VAWIAIMIIDARTFHNFWLCSQYISLNRLNLCKLSTSSHDIPFLAHFVGHFTKLWIARLSRSKAVNCKGFGRKCCLLERLRKSRPSSVKKPISLAKSEPNTFRMQMHCKPIYSTNHMLSGLNYNYIKTQRVGNWISFRLQIRGGEHILCCVH